MYIISTLDLLDQSLCIPACWTSNVQTSFQSFSWQLSVLRRAGPLWHKGSPHSHWSQAATQDLALGLPTLNSLILEGNETSCSAVLVLVWPLYTPYTVNLKSETALTDIFLNAYNYVLNSSIAVHVLTGVPQIIWSVLRSWLGSFTGMDSNTGRK